MAIHVSHIAQLVTSLQISSCYRRSPSRTGFVNQHSVWLTASTLVAIARIGRYLPILWGGALRKSHSQNNPLKAPTEEQFDATEIIAGFPLPSIQRALANVCMLESKDSVQNVAEGLRCPSRQAARVLEELERRGFVVKSNKRAHWDLTQRGKALAFYWKPPGRLHPAIEREDADIACMESFGSATCFVLRPTSDNEDVFEEAMLDVGVNLQYENERVIEVNLMLPHNYDEPEGGATIESSFYINIAEAKAVVSGLQDAVSRAEKELARRAAKGERRAQKSVPRKQGGGDTASRKKSQRR